MDSTAALRIVNDSSAHYDDRLEALESLAEWLARGGAFPTDFGMLSDEACALFGADYDMGGRQLAASVQCALVNGDLSGLGGAL